MNSKEIKIYTLLTHKNAPEAYKIVDDGTRLYVILDGVLHYFEGVDLDKMSDRELVNFYYEKRDEYYKSQLEE